jgi:hypothetical protein
LILIMRGVNISIAMALGSILLSLMVVVATSLLAAKTTRHCCQPGSRLTGPAEALHMLLVECIKSPTL